MLKTILMAAGFVGLAAAGFAQDSYVSLKGGLTSPFDLKYTRPFTGNSVNTQYDSGYAFSGAWGMHVMTNGRFELEGSYQQADVDKHEVSGASSDGSQGSTDVTALMINGYYDLPLGFTMRPYIGAGLGGAYLQYKTHRTTTVGLVSDNQFAPAYQAMAGVSYPLGETMDLNLEYKYFSTSNVELESNHEDVDYSSQSLVAGLTIHF